MKSTNKQEQKLIWDLEAIGAVLTLIALCICIGYGLCYWINYGKISGRVIQIPCSWKEEEKPKAVCIWTEQELKDLVVQDTHEYLENYLQIYLDNIKVEKETAKLEKEIKNKEIKELKKNKKKEETWTKKDEEDFQIWYKEKQDKQVIKDADEKYIKRINDDANYNPKYKNGWEMPNENTDLWTEDDYERYKAKHPGENP